MSDHYAVLGLKHPASLEEIKKAYRKMSLKYHPDKTKDPSHHELFLTISASYEVLSLPRQKSIYDLQFVANNLDDSRRRSFFGYYQHTYAGSDTVYRRAEEERSRLAQERAKREARERMRAEDMIRRRQKEQEKKEQQRQKAEALHRQSQHARLAHLARKEREEREEREKFELLQEKLRQPVKPTTRVSLDAQRGKESMDGANVDVKVREAADGETTDGNTNPLGTPTSRILRSSDRKSRRVPEYSYEPRTSETPETTDSRTNNDRDEDYSDVSGHIHSPLGNTESPLTRSKHKKAQPEKFFPEAIDLTTEDSDSPSDDMELAKSHPTSDFFPPTRSTKIKKGEHVNPFRPKPHYVSEPVEGDTAPHSMSPKAASLHGHSDATPESTTTGFAFDIPAAPNSKCTESNSDAPTMGHAKSTLDSKISPSARSHRNKSFDEDAHKLNNFSESVPFVEINAPPETSKVDILAALARRVQKQQQERAQKRNALISGLPKPKHQTRHVTTPVNEKFPDSTSLASDRDAQKSRLHEGGPDIPETCCAKEKVLNEESVSDGADNTLENPKRRKVDNHSPSPNKAGPTLEELRDELYSGPPPGIRPRSTPKLYGKRPTLPVRSKHRFHTTASAIDQDGQPLDAKESALKRKRANVNPFHLNDLISSLAPDLETVEYTDMLETLPQDSTDTAPVVPPSGNPKPKEYHSHYLDGTSRAETLYTPINKRTVKGHAIPSAPPQTPPIPDMRLPIPPRHELDPLNARLGFEIYANAIEQYRHQFFQYRKHIMQCQYDQIQRDAHHLHATPSQPQYFDEFLEAIEKEMSMHAAYLEQLRVYSNTMQAFQQNWRWMSLVETKLG